MKTKVNYCEYDSLNDLIKRAESLVYRTAYNGLYVYFIPLAGINQETYFHFYITDTKFDGYVAIDRDDNLLFSKSGESMNTGYIPIIYLKNTSFIGEWILEYQKKNFKNI